MLTKRNRRWNPPALDLFRVCFCIAHDFSSFQKAGPGNVAPFGRTGLFRLRKVWLGLTNSIYGITTQPNKPMDGALVLNIKAVT